MILCYFYRYWEAVKHWDEAIQLTPTSAVLHEMKSQVGCVSILGDEYYVYGVCTAGKLMIEPVSCVHARTHDLWVPGMTQKQS